MTQTKQELKQKALERLQKEKQELKEELKDIDTVYVVYLNNQGTEMDFYYAVIDEKGKPYLSKVWITPPYYFDETNKDEYNISPIVDLPFRDKPNHWSKSRSKDGGYCFRATGYGYSKSDECIKSLYYWLGYTHDDIYDKRKLPRVERLN